MVINSEKRRRKIQTSNLLKKGFKWEKAKVTESDSKMLIDIFLWLYNIMGVCNA